MIRRRQFIAGLGSAAAWPIAVRAQQPALPVIGFINGGSAGERPRAAFQKGLVETGYIQGQNVMVEYHCHCHTRQLSCCDRSQSCDCDDPDRLRGR
jgi:hypothetical protein